MTGRRAGISGGYGAGGRSGSVGGGLHPLEGEAGDDDDGGYGFEAQFRAGGADGATVLDGVLVRE